MPLDRNYFHCCSNFEIHLELAVVGSLVVGDWDSVEADDIGCDASTAG